MTHCNSQFARGLMISPGCSRPQINFRPNRHHRSVPSVHANDTGPSHSSAPIAPSPPPAQSSRRDLLLLGPSLAVASGLLLGTSFQLSDPHAAQAFTPPPPGYRRQVDKLDGYTFLYPESWLQVTSSGNDIFYRNPRNIDENVFIDMTSPSSSRYDTVTDLGSPKDAAAKILNQYLEQEFMSTRIGIKREGQVLFATSRKGDDGRDYYDIAIRMTSSSSKNPYRATQAEVMTSYGIEWDRVLRTTIGVANKRLYNLRFQTANDTYSASEALSEKIASSFSVKEVDANPAEQMPSSLRAM